MIRTWGRILVLLVAGWATVGLAADCGKELPARQAPFQAGCVGRATASCLPGDILDIHPAPDSKLQGSDGKPLALAAVCARLRGATRFVDADLQAGAPVLAAPWQQPLAPLIERWLSDPDTRILLAETERGVLKLDLHLTDSAGQQWQVPLNVELGTLWRAGTAASAFALRITHVDCAPCKVGGTIRLTVPELRLWRELGQNDPSKLQLVIDGVRLPGLTPHDQILAVSGAAAAPVVAFNLDQQSGRADMQSAWAAILAAIADDPQHHFNVGLADDHAMLAAAVDQPSFTLPVSRAMCGVVAILAVTLVIVVFGRRTRWCFVRDAYEVPDDLVPPERMPFSLARCQMLLWTGCFVMAWFAIWLFTGEAIVLDATAVALIGVSAGTGLGASAVGQPPVFTRWITAYQAEKATLLAGVAPPAPATLATPPAPAALSMPPAPATLPVTPTPARDMLIQRASSSGLLRDLLSDYGTDSSDLHRMQNVAFTLVFAGYVVGFAIMHGVLPVLNEWQLSLMGISGGSYVGWKVFAK